MKKWLLVARHRPPEILKALSNYIAQPRTSSTIR